MGWAFRTLLIAQLVQGVVRLATQGVPPQQGAPQRRAAQQAPQEGSSEAPAAVRGPAPDRTYYPVFRFGTLMDVAVWTTRDEQLSDEARAALVAESDPCITSTRVPFGAGLSHEKKVELSGEDLAHVRDRNGTLWVQVSAVPSGTPHAPGSPGYIGWAGQWQSHPMVVHPVRRGGTIPSIRRPQDTFVWRLVKLPVLSNPQISLWIDLCVPLRLKGVLSLPLLGVLRHHLVDDVASVLPKVVLVLHTHTHTVVLLLSSYCRNRSPRQHN